MYIGFELSEASRNELLKIFPPEHPAVCSHITLYHGNDSAKKLECFPETVFNNGWEVVGYAHNPVLVALVVAHNGNTVRENYDNLVYHCTHSIADGHRPVESNRVIKRKGWQLLLERIPLEGTVKLFD